MMTIRSADSRGHVEHGWLDSRHTFSFGEYQDPRQMGYGALRVINEDRVMPGGGFAPHAHRSMEIISYVLAGGLRHRDSTGGGTVLQPGSVQLMSAGRGISHSEMNDSRTEPVHFLQIWIVPDRHDSEPRYQQQALDTAALRRGFTAVVGPAGSDAPFEILQDARMLVAWPAAGMALSQALDAERRYYLQVARGAVQVGGAELAAGDAAMFEREAALALTATEDAELLLFDLAA